MNSDLKDVTKSTLNFKLARFSIFMKPTLISLINYDRQGYLIIIHFFCFMLGKERCTPNVPCLLQTSARSSFPEVIFMTSWLHLFATSNKCHWSIAPTYLMVVWKHFSLRSLRDIIQSDHLGVGIQKFILSLFINNVIQMIELLQSNSCLSKI